MIAKLCPSYWLHQISASRGVKEPSHLLPGSGMCSTLSVTVHLLSFRRCAASRFEISSTQGDTLLGITKVSVTFACPNSCSTASTLRLILLRLKTCGQVSTALGMFSLKGPVWHAWFQDRVIDAKLTGIHSDTYSFRYSLSQRVCSTLCFIADSWQNIPYSAALCCCMAVSCSSHSVWSELAHLAFWWCLQHLKGCPGAWCKGHWGPVSWCLPISWSV